MKKKATIVILLIVNANSVSTQSLKSSPLLHTGNEDGNNKKNESPLSSLPSTLPSSSPSSSEISHSFSLGFASMAGILILAVSLIVMQVLFSGCGLRCDHRYADDIFRDGVDTDSDLYLDGGSDMDDSDLDLILPDDSDLSGLNGHMDTSPFLYVGGLILVHAFFIISSCCDNRPDRSYDGVDFSDLHLNDDGGDDTNKFRFSLLGYTFRGECKVYRG